MIVKAIQRAYKIKAERNWDTVYWAIDLHGTCLKSNYENGGYEFINPTAEKALRLISSKKENVIILWSCAYPKVQQEIMSFFRMNGIAVDYFNQNPLEKNSRTGDFTQKFYFSVLLDDKAGFDPDVHWQEIIDFYGLTGN